MVQNKGKSQKKAPKDADTTSEEMEQKAEVVAWP